MKKLVLLLAFILILVTLPITTAEYMSEEDRKSLTFQSIVNAGGEVNKDTTDWVACTHVRGIRSGIFGSIDRRRSQTFTVPRALCQNWVNSGRVFNSNTGISHSTSSGSSEHSARRLVQGAIAGGWKDVHIHSYLVGDLKVSYPGAVEQVSGSNTYPHQGLSVITAPFCPYEIKKISQISDFCNCDGQVVQTSLGGICESADLQICTDIDNCGDGLLYGIASYWRNNPSEFSVDLTNSGSHIIPFSIGSQITSNDIVGTNKYYTFVFVQEEVNNLNFQLIQSDPDQRIQVRLTQIDTRGDIESWSIVNESISETLTGSNQQTSASFNVAPGWFLLRVNYISQGRSSSAFELKLRQGNSDININQVFSVINSKGPISIDHTQFDEEQAEFVCRIDPVFQSFWAESWRPGWGDDLGKNITRCCGNNPSTDWGSVNPATGDVCYNDGWGSEGYCALPYPVGLGERIQGTHIIAETGLCCGPLEGVSACEDQEYTVQAYTELVFCQDIQDAACLPGDTLISGSEVTNTCVVQQIFGGGSNEYVQEVTCRSNSMSPKTITSQYEVVPFTSTCSEAFAKMARCPEKHTESRVMTTTACSDSGIGHESAWNINVEYVESVTCTPQMQSCEVGSSSDEDLEDRLGEIHPRDVEDGQNQFVCMNNLELGDNLEFGVTPNSPAARNIDLPGLSYVWRNAVIINPQHLILQADENHFISNSEQWYYCNALGHAPYYAGGDHTVRLGNFETFELPEDQLESGASCAAGLTRVTSSNVYQCNSSDPVECNAKADEAGDEYFCFAGRTFERGNLYEDCLSPTDNACRKVSGSGGDALSESDFRETLCNIEPHHNFCPSGPGEGQPSRSCFRDGECLNVPTAQLTCEGLHEELFDSYVWYTSKADCDIAQSYCANGDLVEASDSLPGDGKFCCVGVLARCEDKEGLSCEERGGEELSGDVNSDDYVCSGINDQGCCLSGNWQYTPQEQVIPINTSFMCHIKASDDNAFKQCCGAFGCDNHENILHTFDRPAYTFATDGGALHQILLTESIDGRDLFPSLTRTITSKGMNLLNVIQSDIEWSNYQYIEIVYITSSENSSRLEINRGQALALDEFATPYKGPFRAMKAVIPVNWSNLDSIYLLPPEGFEEITGQILIDAIYLQSNDQDYANAYCGSDHGAWVRNLDGSTDEGFAEDAGLEEKAIYQAACNAIPAYGWTGSRCCGDDTFDDDTAEYFTDTQGLCWQGITVKNDQTPQSVVNTELEDPNANRVLFYRGETWLCEGDKVVTQPFYYGSDSPSDFNFNQEEKASLFQVKGSWICMDDGWQRYGEMNRITILAAALSNLPNDDYTLHCDDYHGVSNYIPQALSNSEYNSWTKSACVLRDGSNEQDADRVAIGLEVRDIFRPIQEYSDEVLERTYFLEGQNITCTAPLDPEPGAFFTKCEAQATRHVYYNRPFNLVIISSHSLDNINGFTNPNPNVLQRFLNWFSNLFGGEDEGLQIGDIRLGENVHKYYRSQQGDKVVTGTAVEIVDEATNSGATAISVNYQNTGINSQFLCNVLAERHQNTDISIGGADGGFTVEVPGSPDNVDWRRITSALRMTSASGASNVQTGLCVGAQSSQNGNGNGFAPNDNGNPNGNGNGEEIVYSQNFQNVDVGTGFGWRSEFLTVQEIQGNRFLRAQYDRDEEIGSPRLGFRDKIPASNSYTLEYRVFFKEGFEFVMGGKLPGLGSLDGTTGGSDVEPDKWSARLMWRGPDSPTGEAVEIYYYDQDRAQGSHGQSLRNTNFAFSTGTWYDIKLFVRVNDVGRSNGVLALSVNGNELVRDQNVRLRGNVDASEGLIEEFHFSTFFGGSDINWAPSQTVYARFDDFVVY